MPVTSALSVVPRRAMSVPTAGCSGCHSIRCTFVVVTATGGGTMCFPAWIMVKIWKNFVPARKTTIASRPPPAISQRLRLERRVTFTPEPVSKLRSSRVVVEAGWNMERSILASEGAPL